MITESPIKANFGTEFNMESNIDSAPEFKNINEITDVLSFLKAKGCNHKEYHHYTDLDSIIKIIHSGYFHLTRGNSTVMNDQHECLVKGSYDIWQRTYLGCFAFGESENMAMWGLYGLPWEDAVRITIPRKTMQNWIKNTHELYDVKNISGNLQRKPLTTKATIKLSDIVYINGKRNFDSSKLFWNDTSISLSDKQGLSDIDRKPEMTGFIKNDAWKYENEVRIHVQFDNMVNTEKIAIKLSDDFTQSITITAGPYFSGDLLQRIEERIPQIINDKQTGESSFKHLVNYKTICSICQYNKFKRKVR